MGVKVIISELDLNVLPSPTRSHSADVSLRFASRAGLNPCTNGLSESVQRQLAQRYADLFAVFLKHRDSISRLTFCGVTDRDSWLNDWPIQERTDYPLLFNRVGKPEPAYFAVLKAARIQLSQNNSSSAH